jgi:hypothetical protein
MKIRNLVGTAAATAVVLSFAGVAPASAIDNIKVLGQQEIFRDGSGALIGYTVTSITPSADPIPVAGRLYEATVTAEAVAGTVTPVIPNFNARAESGANYRVLAGVFTPQGLSGATLLQGGRNTGKLYFDVVGDLPNSVVYNDGSHDILGWIAVPNAPGSGGDSTGGGSSGAENAQPGGVTGSTGPNFTEPNTTAGDQSGQSGVTGSDPGSGGGGLIGGASGGGLGGLGG